MRRLLFITPVMVASLGRMEVWLDARRGGSPKTLENAENLFDRVLCTEDTAAAFSNAACLVADAEADGVCKLRSKGAIAGGSTVVSCGETQKRATALVGSVDWLHVDALAGQPMIVAENLLGAAEDSGTRVACSVAEAEDVPGLAFALRRGVDALVLDDGCNAATLEAATIAKAQRAEDAADDALARDVDARDAGPTLEAWDVVGVEEGSVSDRVALDLTSLMAHDEGCLVGSSAKALALVLGETATGGFVPPRPFRCNAGPVHSYVAMADGKTKYLSEVGAGDRVLVVSGRGSRAAEVGRAKVEPRPTLRVDLERGGKKGNVFLQQAETVRLAGAAGDPLAVTKAKAGDRVLVAFDDRGTHVGGRISVRVDER